MGKNTLGPFWERLNGSTTFMKMILKHIEVSLTSKVSNCMTSASIAIESFKLLLTMSIYWTEFIKQQYEKHRYHDRNDRKWTSFLIYIWFIWYKVINQTNVPCPPEDTKVWKSLEEFSKKWLNRFADNSVLIRGCI